MRLSLTKVKPYFRKNREKKSRIYRLRSPFSLREQLLATTAWIFARVRYGGSAVKDLLLTSPMSELLMDPSTFTSSRKFVEPTV